MTMQATFSVVRPISFLPATISRRAVAHQAEEQAALSPEQTDMPKTADADTYRILVILLLSLGGSIEILASFPGKKTEIA